MPILFHHVLAFIPMLKQGVLPQVCIDSPPFCGWMFFCNIRNESPIMRYTGLKDKNGRDIYEGDIVKVEYGRGTIVYNEYMGAFMIEWIDDKEANMEFINYRLQSASNRAEQRMCEVIGNIYENKELLK